ncbi:MAG: Dabb family protein [Clostridiales bacterium]|nr:Dabb family protein [Clostridiales bacterium]
MVRHIVCFKLKDSSLESCRKLREVLFSMEGKVPMIKNLEVRLDELKSARSYDVFLSVDVDSWQQLDNYQNDPYHLNIVKKYVQSVASNSVAVDFEI